MCELIFYFIYVPQHWNFPLAWDLHFPLGFGVASNWLQVRPILLMFQERDSIQWNCLKFTTRTSLLLPLWGLMGSAMPWSHSLTLLQIKDEHSQSRWCEREVKHSSNEGLSALALQGLDPILTPIRWVHPAGHQSITGPRDTPKCMLIVTHQFRIT